MNPFGTLQKGVVFISDNARELTGAASKLGWIADPSVPGFWPRNANCECEVRSLKELVHPAHVAAGFQKKLWPLPVDFTAKARSFFGLSPVLRRERGTRKAELKQGKTATGQVFDGPKFPLGVLVFYKAKGDGLSEPGTKPGLFVGWHLSPGLQYKGTFSYLTMRQ